MSLKLRSDSVTLIGRHREKLAIAGNRGIEGVVADKAEGLKKSFDIVVEASGSESGFAAAMDLVKPRGTIVLKSTFHGDPRWDAARVVVDEISVVGSRCGRLAPAIELLASKRVQVDDLISEEFPLADGVSALRAAEAKGILKVLLRP